MSATRGGKLKTRRNGRQHRAIGLSVSLYLATATVAGLSLTMAWDVRADDRKSPELTRLASIGGAENPPWRLGLPARFADVDVDLKVLLAQNRPQVQTDAVNGDDTILVALALAVPQSVEEDIAGQYGLELIDRTELTDLGLRIVQFRAKDNRAIGPILAALHKDERISRAQRNARYAPTPGKAAAGVAAADPDVKVQAPPVRRPNRPPAANLRQRLAGPVSVDEPAGSPAAKPLRVGNVGDVLSGGL